MKLLIFYGSEFYPSGGWNDFQGTATSLHQAKDFLLEKSSEWDWCQVVNMDSLEEVYSCYKKDVC